MQYKLLQYYRETEIVKSQCETIRAKVRFIYSRHQDAVDDDALLLMWFEHHFGLNFNQVSAIKREGRYLRNTQKEFTRSVMAEIYSRKRQEQQRQKWSNHK